MGVILDERVQPVGAGRPRSLAVMLAALVAAPIAAGLVVSAIGGAPGTSVPSVAPPHVTASR